MNSKKTASVPESGLDSGELSHREILTILVGLMMGMFLAALDQTVVSTSIRTIADDLKGLDAQAWVTTAYLVTSTVMTPVFGKLSDIYGRKPFFLSAIVIFIIGSLACSFATSMYELAAFRAIQGIGAGGLMPLALAIIGDIVPPRERARYQGYMLAVFASSSVLGPVIGGFFADAPAIFGITGWRWVFLINVPLGLLALAGVMFTLRLSHVRRLAKIDWFGIATLVLGVVPLLLVAEQGREWGWTSTYAIASYVIGVSGIAAFIAVEHRMGDAAIIPLRIFSNRTMTISIIGGVVVGMAMFGGLMMVPLYMQIVQGASPMKSGFMMLPMVGGMMLFAITSGRYTSKTGVIRPFPIIGTAVLAVGFLSLSFITAQTSLLLTMAQIFIVGTGLGMCMQPLTLIVQNAMPPSEIGMATSSATFFRQMGGTVGVAVFLSVLFSSVAGRTETELKEAASSPEFTQALASAAQDPAVQSNPQSTAIVNALIDPSSGSGALTSVTKDSSVLAYLPDAVSLPFREGFADAMGTVFLSAGMLSVLGFAILMFLPAIELRSGSARAEAAREASQEA